MYNQMGPFRCDMDADPQERCNTSNRAMASARRMQEMIDGASQRIRTNPRGRIRRLAWTDAVAALHSLYISVFPFGATF